MAGQSRVLRFPNAGVNRRLGFFDSANIRQDHYPTPWAVNCRPEDIIARRLRGGSRPGLVKFCDNALGTTVTNMVALDLAATTGASTILAAIADDALAVVDVAARTVAYPAGLLATDAGVQLQTDAGVDLEVSSAAIATPCFLVSRAMLLYAITSNGVTVIDPKTGVVSPLIATAGTVPTGCTFGCVYRDRLVMAGGDNAVYMSRLGDPTDWDFGGDVEDTGRAVAFQLSEAGEVGEVATALMPHQDAFLLAATVNGLWAIRGDPAADGSLRNVTRDTGVVGSLAWVKTPTGIIFLGRNNLYRVGVDGGKLENLSGDKIPDELRDLDTISDIISLGWNQDESGVYIFFTDTVAPGYHWYFDLLQGGFWPMALQDDHQPNAVAVVNNQMVIAGTDGYLRQFQSYDDDDTPIVSHLVIGPLPMAGPATFGRLVSFHGALGNESKTVTWSICLGDTAEGAAENAKTAIELYNAGNTAGAAALVVASGTFEAGRNHVNYPRVRAVWMAIWLRATSHWAFEGICITTSESGKWR